MEIIENLSKKQLIQLVEKHPKCIKQCSSWSKGKLVDYILTHDIPFIMDQENIEQYSLKTLQHKASQYSDFKKSKHGKTKHHIIEFLKERFDDEKKDNIIIIKEKLLECLTKETEIELSQNDCQELMEMWL